MPQDNQKILKNKKEDCGKSYREKRMDDSVKNFLNGKARRPYVLREDITRGLEARATSNLGNDKNENIDVIKNKNTSPSCTCLETLGQFAGEFKNMFHTGQELIRRASIRQPKSPNKKISKYH